METGLTGHQYAGLFWQGVVKNINHWRRYAAACQTDYAALQQEYIQIISALDYALELQTAWPETHKLIIALSDFMERRGYWDVWNRILRRAIKTAQHLNSATNEVALSALLARLLFQQSCFREAVRASRRVIRLARQIGDLFNEARTCTNLGYHYIEQGYWFRAEALCCYALNLFEQLDNDHGRAHTENHLGVLYTRQGCWGRAQKRLERACAIWQAMGDEHGLMRGLINLGGLYIAMNQPDAALNHLEKALRLAKSTGDKTTTLGIIYENIGIAHRLNGNLPEAEEYLEQAGCIFRQFSNLMEQARVWYSLGLIYFSQGKQSQAMALLEATLETWRDLGNKFGETAVLVDLVERELARKNWPAAEKHLKAAEQLIGSDNQNRPDIHILQSRLVEYRRILE